MKKCLQCGREYDLSMSYCLDDGSELLYGPAMSGPKPAGTIASGVADEAQTAILQETLLLPSEAVTRAQLIPPDGATANHKRDAPTVSDRRSLIAGVLGVLLVTFLGVGSYWLYGRGRDARIGSIAVLPFVNDGGTADVDYLSDGMTETLISNLSKMSDLNVKPRSMVFRYKGKDADPKIAGSELGVEAILSGRLQSRGDSLSLFVELVDVATTKVVWSQRYDRKQSDIVALQSDVARDVSGKINSAISAADATKVARKATENPEAYRLYLLANSLAGRRKTNDLRTALDYYNRAIALDPNYALAYTGIAAGHVFMTIYGGEPGETELVKARAAAARALEIDPDLPEAHNILGGVELYLNRDWAANERHNARALEINPNFGNAYRHNGIRQAWLGQFDKAVASLQRATELDPISVVLYTNLAWTYAFAGRLDDSEASLKKAREIDPTFWFIEFFSFMNSRTKGDLAAAAEHLARAQELRDEPDAARFIRNAFAKGGWPGLQRACVVDPSASKLSDYALATFAIDLGDKERAFAYLDQAEKKYDQFVFFAKIDPALEPVRDDPRYRQLLQKLGFPDQQ